MATYAELRGQLTHLKSEIQQKLPGLLLGRPADDSEADRRSEELAKFADRLDSLRAAFQNHENLLAMQSRQAQGAARWPAKDRLQDVQKAKKEAEDLTKLINDLVQRNGLNLMQAVQQFHDLVDNFEQSSSHTQVAGLQHSVQPKTGTVSVPPKPAVPEMGTLGMLDAAAPSIAVAVILLRKLASLFKRRRK